MSPLEKLQSLESRVDALALRERALLLAALLAIAFFLVDALLLRPQQQRREQISGQIEQVEQRVSTISQSIEQLAKRAGDDPDIELRARRDQLQALLATLQTELAEFGTGLVTPEAALDNLEQLLRARPGLKLLALNSQPAVPVDPDNPSGLFLHRVELVLEGGFGDVLAYLRESEDRLPGLHQELLRIEVQQWPTNRATLVLFMLALNEDWLGV
ncbi:MAG: hypothetical protein RQ729_09595 [Wenzhouxiangellaceae bacterium]|nr:hypothetical protein [Wenzhouxiangellaceae bacterium]